MTDYRRVDVILQDLQKMQAELSDQQPASTGKDSNSAFETGKLELTRQLDLLGKRVQALVDMRQGLEGGGRNVDSIRLQAENRKSLSAALVVWNRLAELLQQDAKRTVSQQPDATGLQDRQALLQLMHGELMSLTSKNSGFNSNEPDRTAGVAGRRERIRQQRQVRQQQPHGAAGEIEMPIGQGDAKQEMILSQGLDEQDELLQQLMQALKQLEQIALDIQKGLKLQEHLIDAIDVKVDTNIQHLQNANVRLDQLKQRLGLGSPALLVSRLCMGTILIALVVYGLQLWS